MAQTENVWIDLLPIEVCAQIAHQTCGGRQTETALSLAQVSKKQSTAVDRSISGILTIASDRSEPSRFYGRLIDEQFEDIEWATVLPHRALRVKANDSEPRVINLLRNGRVVEAIIDADSDELVAATCETNSVKKLSIRFWKGADLPKVRKQVQRAELREVKLVSITESLRFRFFNGVTSLECQKLVSSAPSLKLLQVENELDFDDMGFYDFLEDPFANWSGISKLPIITAFDLVEEPPETLRPRLATFKSLTVRGLETRVARELKDAVVEYHSDGDGLKNVEGILLDSTMLQDLAHCQNIRKLIIKVLIDHQEAVIDLCAKLKNLRVLVVTWFHSLHDSGLAAPRPIPKPGLTARMFYSASKVVEAEIGVNRQHVEEAEKVLQQIGPRIQILSLNMLQESEGVVFVIERMLLTLTCHAKVLKELRFIGMLDRTFSDEDLEQVSLLEERLLRKFPGINNGKLGGALVFCLSRSHC